MFKIVDMLNKKSTQKINSIWLSKFMNINQYLYKEKDTNIRN